MKVERADLLIIGTGQGGVPLAADAAAAGKHVVVFEREQLGGSCVNWGCTPSKAFLGAAHAAGRARLSASLGVDCDVRVEFDKVMARVRSVRDRWNTGVEEKLSSAGVGIVHGEASFRRDGTVEADGQAYGAPVTVIDTGSHPTVPDIEGLADGPYLTDHTLWDIETLPTRLAVIGGGYVGLELGQAFARLGSKVTLFEQAERILATEAPDVGDVLREALERDGVEILENTVVEKATHDGDTWHLRAGDKDYEADAVLVAAGRTPNTSALEVAGTGIELDEAGFVKVDPHFKATKGVYAIGEAAGQPAFTHVAWEDYRRLKSILEEGVRRRDDRILGYGVFTDPQVGRAGLSQQQAEARGYPVRVAEMPVKDMARAVEWGHSLGFYRLVFNAESGRLLGAELVGHEATEIVHVLLDLIEQGGTAEQLGSWQHIHPTYAENLPTLARETEPPTD